MKYTIHQWKITMEIAAIGNCICIFPVIIHTSSYHFTLNFWKSNIDILRSHDIEKLIMQSIYLPNECFVGVCVQCSDDLVPNASWECLSSGFCHCIGQIEFHNPSSKHDMKWDEKLFEMEILMIHLIGKWFSEANSKSFDFVWVASSKDPFS